MGCHLWAHTEPDMTEVTQQQQQSLLGYENWRDWKVVGPQPSLSLPRVPIFCHTCLT